MVSEEVHKLCNVLVSNAMRSAPQGYSNIGPIETTLQYFEKQLF